MLDLSRMALLAVCLIGAATTLSAAEPAIKPPDHPSIPGFERFYAAPGADAVKGGQLLLSELNCVSCHAADSKAQAARKQAPILDGLATRVRSSFLKKFLSSPQTAKPGTSMPDVFAGLPEKERQDNVEALAHLFASSGTLKQEAPDKKAAVLGRDLYGKIGCVVCHGTRDAAGNQFKLFDTSVPLPDLHAKYSLTSLRTFLENPHAVRPGGRMPRLLDAKEARSVANYLMQGAPFSSALANLEYAYYEGIWQKLPDFAKLKSKAKGVSSGFDLSHARRQINMALKFEGYLQLERDGNYKFSLHSDDGSKLWVDGNLVVNNDGIHAPATAQGAAVLVKGVHKITVGIFNAGGGVELDVGVKGPGLAQQDLGPLLTRTAAGNSDKKTPEIASDSFPINEELVNKGRLLFHQARCDSCHQFKVEKAVAAAKAKPLAELKGQGGCIDVKPGKDIPWYPLSPAQRTALVAALKAPAPVEQPADVIARTLATFNCYACHARDKVGGVQQALNLSFTTTQPEMGDEGRFPPLLDGVGAKLNPDYFLEILDKGSHDRPYMHVRMPGFGVANVGHLPALFKSLDKLEPVPAVAFTDSTPAKVKAAGRHMVGAQALGCIKCHTFLGNKAEGVQGIEMVLMPKRVTRDWFVRYLLDPQKFRAGTRMPAAWFNGTSALPMVLGGDTPQQIEAIWIYLSDKKPVLPVGVKKQYLPLEPIKDAIIYRNFIEGAGTRAIAVGYPEHLNLAFDANDMRLALLWHGPFLDATRHWTGRGQGFEGPLGDNILHMPAGVSLAVLAEEKAPWPKESARQLGYHFRGYKLGAEDRPTFLYSAAGVQVEDRPEVVVGKSRTSLKRTLIVTGPEAVKDVWFRAAVAKKIESVGESRYRINGEWTVKIEEPAGIRVRESEGKTELLVPVRLQDGRARIIEDIEW